MITPYVKIIGNGDAFGSGNRYHTSFLLNTGYGKTLIDLGSTAFFNLKKLGEFTNDIDVIVLSHYHGDHFGGVPFFILDAIFESGRKKPLNIVGPIGGTEIIISLVETLYPGISERIEFEIDITEYEYGKTIDLNELSIEAVPVIHTPETNPHGLRVSFEDKSLAYSGDTSWTENLIPLASGTDIFICECNFYNSQSFGHLNYLEIEENQTRFKTKRMLLTHLGDEALQNQNQFKIEVCSEGNEYPL